MKKTLHYVSACLIGLSISSIQSHAQNWTWMKGDVTEDESGVYGTLGTSAASNKPGARQNAVTWSDATGNLWLFGGEGYDNSGSSGYLNDLWKYSSSTNQWTWIKGDNNIAKNGVYGTLGAAAASNKPGSRSGSVSWTDASGNLWLFGGSGFATSVSSGRLNDLWKYNPSTNQWTWINGDNTLNQNGVYGTQGSAAAINKPGARQNAVSWTDASGNLWLFGGIGFDNAGFLEYLNDLWKYNPATNQWTWIKGDNTIGEKGVYGSLGAAATSNKPGARGNLLSWADASGNLWLFGGYGYANSGSSGYVNDLWKYNPSNNQWTWMKGDSIKSQLGVYGTKGIAAASNKPGGRSDAVSWIDASGNLWFFGGKGKANFGATLHNDLWKYNPATNEWTWMKGSSVQDQPGVYGTQGTAAASNNPGGRYGSVSWTDNTGNAWLFGGFEDFVTGEYGALNDLWKLPFGLTTGINEAEVNGLQIFPNPTSGEFTIAFKSVPSNTSIKLYNLLGELVLEENVNTLSATIHINQLANGIYQLAVLADNHIIQSQKIIKQ